MKANQTRSRRQAEAGKNKRLFFFHFRGQFCFDLVKINQVFRLYVMKYCVIQFSRTFRKRNKRDNWLDNSYFSILECRCTWRKCRVLPYLTSVMCVNLSFAMVLDNTTSPDYQLCVKTMYQARDKEIVEVPWCSTLWQSFNWKTLFHLMYTCIVYVC